ncbi:MAG: TetR/AcrR family transcriptional regulator [Lachnospiraceae bacterium]|nr:TetR/AcrR family transcriptional regulator [Lachnospiraceae bacterium]
MLLRILQASIEELKENGVKFTMDSLAKRLGISKRTLYETVSSKEDVIGLVIEHVFADVKEKQQAILEDSSLSTAEKLRELFNVVPAYVDVLDYRRISDIKKSYPKMHESILVHIESDWEPTIRLLEQGMQEGVIRSCNLVVLKMLLCEIFEQLLNGTILIQNEISYEHALKEMIGIILEGILTREKEEAK